MKTAIQTEVAPFQDDLVNARSELQKALDAAKAVSSLLANFDL